MNKISIIIPVYNVEKYIGKCLDSIINQTYKNLEIIVINDGSTDNSGGVIEQYAKYDNRIQVIHKKNEGISKARNLGLDICTGDYISFIDSDDFIRKDTYEILLNYIQRKDIDIVWYDYLEYACQGSNLLEQRQNMFIEEKYYDLDNSRDRKDFAKDLFNKYHLIGYVWNKLYKRQIWKNIRFPYKMSCEDGYVLMSSLTKAKNILVIPNSLYYYRVDNYNSSTKKRPQNFKYSFVESRLIRAIEYSCLYPKVLCQMLGYKR